MERTESNASWLLDAMLKTTGLRVRQRADGQSYVYLCTKDLYNPKLVALETRVKAVAPKQLKRIDRGKLRRPRELAKLILELNGIEPRLDTGIVEGKHTVRYELGLCDLQRHGAYLE